MFGMFKNIFGRSPASPYKRGVSTGYRTGMVRGRYDAAATTHENRRHWANADGLSPNAAMSAEVRRTLRNRARYEVANNSYAKGIVLTLANDTVGTGPRLQLLAEDDATNRKVELAFTRWAENIGLAEKLRTMRMARAQDGEVFALLTANPMLASLVKLDLRLLEADQVATPSPIHSSNSVDGIVYDDYGNPVAYHVLKQHPGDLTQLDTLSKTDVPVSHMIHWYRADRPGQGRGVPEITPALPLFAQLRRYTLAVIAAAETAADFAAVLYTDAPAHGEAESFPAFDLVDLERRMATVLPGGWKMGQVNAEQPSTTYDMFKREILNEIARCLNIPYNIAACNSSGYNYASGRLDHQTYYKSLRVDQSHLGRVVLDKIFAAWLQEASLIEGLLPQSLRRIGAMPEHQWFWDGMEHVDPLKEANAQATRLTNHTTTLAGEYARQGRDWESELRQRAKEVALMNELGLSPATAAPTAPDGEPEPDDDQELDDDETQDRSQQRDAARNPAGA